MSLLDPKPCQRLAFCGFFIHSGLLAVSFHSSLLAVSSLLLFGSTHYCEIKIPSEAILLSWTCGVVRVKPNWKSLVHLL